MHDLVVSCIEAGGGAHGVSIKTLRICVEETRVDGGFVATSLVMRSAGGKINLGRDVLIMIATLGFPDELRLYMATAANLYMPSGIESHVRISVTIPQAVRPPVDSDLSKYFDEFHEKMGANGLFCVARLSLKPGEALAPLDPPNLDEMFGLSDAAIARRAHLEATSLVDPPMAGGKRPIARTPAPPPKRADEADDSDTMSD